MGKEKNFVLLFIKMGTFGSIGIKVALTAADWLTWGDAQKKVR